MGDTPADARPALAESRWIAAPRLIIAVATAASLLLSFTLSAIWFFVTKGTSRFDPAVQVLGLLAGITGLVAERRAAAVERREHALLAVRHELETNRRILDALALGAGAVPRREIYQRLHSSAVDAALSSVVLLPKKDDVLSSELHEWRNTVNTFNQRLSIAEILAFTADSYDVLAELHELIHGNGGAVRRIRSQLTSLLARWPVSARA